MSGVVVIAELDRLAVAAEVEGGELREAGEVGVVGRRDRGGHHDHDRSLGLAQHGQEQLGEVVATEVVHGEEGVQSVGRAALLESEHSGGVHEGIDPVLLVEHATGGIADTGVGGQVRGDEGRPVGLVPEGGQGGLALALVTSHEDDAVAVGEEIAGGLAADAAVAAGDEDGLHDAPGKGAGGRRLDGGVAWRPPVVGVVRRR
ncbi:hypothetical protein OG512_04595 [Streptomyces sp. NBC_01378]